MADKMNHKPVLSEVEWIETHKSTISLRKSKISPLIHPFTHQPIHYFMQNEPNFKPPAMKNMQNKANLNQPVTRFTRQNTQTVQILTQHLYAFTQKECKKCSLFVNISKQHT